MTEEVAIETTKRCPFCAETIQSDAIVCRFCDRDLTQKSTPPSDRRFTILLVVVGIVFGLIAIGHMVGSETPQQRIARMEKACQEQFGAEGDLAVGNCKLRAMTDYYEKLQKEKQDRANDAMR